MTTHKSEIVFAEGKAIHKITEGATDDVIIPADERIAELKELLRETDYQAIKFAEGWITDEEYSEVRQQREAWREEIRELEDAK